MRVSRLDISRLDAAERTPQGFLRAPAYLTRAGVLTYYNADGSPRREWRPTAEVMRADSLATLISAPVTDQHPPEMVSVENRAKYDAGNVGDEIVRDGGKVRATIYVKDSKLITAVERGDMREVSCGYLCDTEESPGVVPEGEPDAGAHYDAIQRNIAYNHVAVVPLGRAGSEIRLRLDAASNVIPPASGANHEDHMDEKLKALEERLAKAEKRADEAEAKLKERADTADSLQAKLDAATAELKKFRDDAAAAARKAIEANARKVLGAEAKFDGKDTAAIKREVAAKGAPELKLDGKSDAYVDAAFDLAVSRADAETEALGELRRDAEGATLADAASDERFDVNAARQQMVERNRSASMKRAKA